MQRSQTEASERKASQEVMLFSEILVVQCQQLLSKQLPDL